MKCIYLIKNLITDKAYIGQSVNPQKRFNSHMGKHSSSKALSDDVDKYGEESFKLFVLEECQSDFLEREKFWIQKCIDSNIVLYNKTKGGEDPPTYWGEEHASCIYTDKQKEDVANLILNTNYSFSKISKMTNTSQDFVRRTNQGVRRIEGFDYPLRTENHFDKIAKMIIEDLESTNEVQRNIARKYGVSRSMVTMINIGENHYNDNIDYPIRNPVLWTPKEALKQIKEDFGTGNYNYNQLSKKYNINYRTVRNCCLK